MPSIYISTYQSIIINVLLFILCHIFIYLFIMSSICLGGVLGLTRSLSKEFAIRGVTVNAVCPGSCKKDVVMSRLHQFYI